jgi:hypothetical protein
MKILTCGFGLIIATVEAGPEGNANVLLGASSIPV